MSLLVVGTSWSTWKDQSDNEIQPLNLIYTTCIQCSVDCGRDLVVRIVASQWHCVPGRPLARVRLPAAAPPLASEAFGKLPTKALSQ